MKWLPICMVYMIHCSMGPIELTRIFARLFQVILGYFINTYKLYFCSRGKNGRRANRGAYSIWPFFFLPDKRHYRISTTWNGSFLPNGPVCADFEHAYEPRRQANWLLDYTETLAANGASLFTYKCLIATKLDFTKDAKHLTAAGHKQPDGRYAPRRPQTRPRVLC